MLKADRNMLEKRSVLKYKVFSRKASFQSLSFRTSYFQFLVYIVVGAIK